MVLNTTHVPWEGRHAFPSALTALSNSAFLKDNLREQPQRKSADHGTCTEMLIHPYLPIPGKKANQNVPGTHSGKAWYSVLAQSSDLISSDYVNKLIQTVCFWNYTREDRISCPQGTHNMNWKQDTQKYTRLTRAGSYAELEQNLTIRDLNESKTQRANAITKEDWE